MCEDYGATDGTAEPAGVSRRSFLKAAAYSSAAAAVFSRLNWVPPAAAATIDGAYSMAMHIHSSFSEMYGSMNTHLNQAQENNVDVIWWTDHDTKMNGIHDRNVVHFTSLTDETGDGAPWLWKMQRAGSLTTASTGGIAASPASPLDTVPEGSLQLTAQSTGTGTASLGFYPEPSPTKQNWRNNLTGQTLSIEVLPISVSSTGYLEFEITSSYHPATGGRTAGQYTLSYRLAGSSAEVSRRSSDRLGIVTLPCIPGEWNSLVLRPTDDLNAIFPELDGRDFSLYALSFNAVSTGAVASGYFDYLRFSRQTTGEVALQVQGDLAAAYSGRYPTVMQRQGLEVSHGDPHLNWFGGTITLPDYTGVKKSEYPDFLAHTVVPEIHNGGGLASYNHAYGTTWIDELPQATQDQLLSQMAANLLANKALGTDILEVGYDVRAGVDLAHHVGLWDVCSRNALFLTGNGASDDHKGADWTHAMGRWITSAWAAGKDEASLLDALGAGRAWCASLPDYRGAMDLLIDDTCQMGSASVSRRRRRELLATATAVPNGGSLRIVQGVVDYAGTDNPVPATQVVATVKNAALSAGRVHIAVDNHESSFIRSEVVDSGGNILALSNPVWLLREVPQSGIPASRAC